MLRPTQQTGRVWSVVIELRGPLLRALGGTDSALQLSCLSGPGESSTAFHAATIGSRARIARPDHRRRGLRRRAPGTVDHGGDGAWTPRRTRYSGRARGPRRPAGDLDPASGQVPGDRAGP